MNINQLRHFIELAKTDSIAQASQRLYISPQGLNKSVSTIEKELNTKLVNRMHHGTFLTANGMKFLRFAEDTVRAFDSIVKDIGNDSVDLSGRTPYIIGATSYVFRVMEKELSDLQELYGVRLEEMSPSSILQCLESGNNEDKIFITDLLKESSFSKTLTEGFEVTPLFKTELGILAHKEFPINAKVLLSGDLRNVPLVRYNDESIDWIMENAFEDDPPKNVIFRTSNAEQMIEWAASKRAVSLFDTFAFHVLMADSTNEALSCRFIPFSNMSPITIGLVSRVNRNKTEAIEFLENHLVSHFQNKYASYLRRFPSGHKQE